MATKILHVIEALGRAGAERVALELAAGMRARGLESCIIGLRQTDEYDDYPSVPRSFLLPFAEYRWPTCLPRLVWNLKRALRRFDPDAIEVHSPRAAIVLALAGARGRMVQVLHSRDICWARNGSLRRRATLELECWVAGRMKHGLIGVCQAVAADAREHLRQQPHRITCVFNGVDTKRFEFAERNLSQAPVVGVLGSLIRRKRPERALAAFWQLRQRRPNAQLWFIGEGPMRAELAAEIARNNGNSAVRLLGIRKDIPELLSQMHLLWHLSELEGFGLAPAEAMATGLPVIAADAEGTREVVDDGRTGWLVPVPQTNLVAEISDQCLAAPIEYSRFSSASRQRALDRFSLNAMVEGHIQALFRNGSVAAGI